MNGPTVLSSAAIGNVPTNWSVVGTGDFNGDGKRDIAWREPGDTAIWLMDGAWMLSSGGLGIMPTTWWMHFKRETTTATARATFSGRARGNTAIWFMNGTTVAATAGVGNIPTNWTVQSVNAE